MKKVFVRVVLTCAMAIMAVCANPGSGSAVQASACGAIGRSSNSPIVAGVKRIADGDIIVPPIIIEQ